MKKLLLIALAVGMIGTAHAQRTEAVRAEAKLERAESKGTPEERAKKRTDRLTETLALNEKQQKQVYELTLEQIKDREQLRQQRNDMRIESTAKRENAEKKMAEILNEEQRAKWEEHKKQNRERRMDRAGSERKADAKAGSAAATAKKNCSKECAKTCADKKK